MRLSSSFFSFFIPKNISLAVGISAVGISTLVFNFLIF
jgi:hypothetical protein